MKSSSLLAGLALAMTFGLGCRRNPDKETSLGSLSIAVEVEGKQGPAIDASALASHAPDYADGGRRAWRLTTLLGPALARPGTSLEVEDGEGTKTAFGDPAARADHREPMLLVNQRGEAIVALVDPADPWPAFHGRGGNRGRPGDPAPRIRSVKSLRLTKASKVTPDAHASPSLSLIVDGKAARAVTQGELAELPRLEVAGDSGDGPRPGWSIRDLVSRLVAPGARLVALRAEGGRSLAISPQEWNDPERIPIARVNRRGQLKFQWVAKSSGAILGEGLRGVVALEVTTGKAP